MTSIKHDALAQWITATLVAEKVARKDFPDLGGKVCPDCGFRDEIDRRACPIHNTVMVPTMKRLGQPQVLLEALKDCDLAQRYVGKSYLAPGVLCWVFEGLSVETVEPVAIKILRHELAADKKTNARFVSEAQMWQALKHQNIMPVLETGLIPELVAHQPQVRGNIIPWDDDTAYDRPYIVMEYVEGVNLKTVLQGYGALGPELTMSIVMKVLEALNCAHKQEIVHRDLKPSNIFLVPDDAGEIEVKVSDFGLAARMFRQTEWTPQTTKTGSVYGDPSYLSPEYLIEQKTSPRSDLYALGCIMYECISGKSPFAGQHEFHTMIRHVKDRPSPLPKELKLPEQLEKAIYRAIEKEPANRFDSAEHMRTYLAVLAEKVSTH